PRDREAAQERDARLAQRREDPVVLLGGGAGADDRRLLPRREPAERDPPLPLEREHARVAGADQVHDAVELEEALGGERGLLRSGQELPLVVEDREEPGLG